MIMELKELSRLAYDLRKDTVDMIMAGNGGHIGGDMSVMETLVTLYFDQMNINPENMNDPERDLFVMSKGHSVEAYYAVLAKKGFLDIKEVTEKFSKFGSQYIGHPNNKLPGIEMNSGSLGHGLPVCVGMALAGKMDKKNYRVYTVMGDGELAEGSVWEAAMAGHQYKLDNLCAVADGNSIEQLHDAFEEAKRTKGQPTVLIANTVKGKGSSVMENKAAWHHHVPTAEEYEQIMKDFEVRKEML